MKGTPDGWDHEAERSAVILAGGLSRRFGKDKLWAQIRKKSFLEEVARSLHESRFKVAISLASPKSLPESLFPDVIVYDPLPFEGPLQALLGPLLQLKCDRLLVVACDMPLMVPAVLNALWNESINADITLLPTNQKRATLPAVYSRRVIPHIEALLHEGKRDLKALLGRDLTVHTLSEKRLEVLDSQGLTLININTPAELQRTKDLV